MVICSRCKTVNDDNSRFCCQCGNDLTVNVDAPASEELKNLANTLNEQAVHTAENPFNLNKVISSIPAEIGKGFKQVGKSIADLFKKIGKKRLITISGILFVLVAGIILTVNYIVPLAPHYLNGNSAFESNDYITAIAEYKLAGNFLNAKSKLNDAHYLYAEKLYGEDKFYEAAIHYKFVANDDGVNKKLIQCGTKLLENKKYKDALEVFEAINTDEVAQQKNYVLGMISFFKDSYEEAKKDFKAAGKYNDSEAMVNACDLMIADGYCKEGKFEKAKSIYLSLPEGFTYGDISASGRLALLNNSQDLIDAMGTWTATDNYIETRNVYTITGSWNSWYHGHDNVLSGQSIKVKCTMNSNNTFDIDGEVSFYKFDDYYSLSAYCKSKKTSKTFSIDNVTTIPSSYQIDSCTTLNYSGGVFSIKYSERDNYSAYFYNVYSSSVTYGNKS